MLTQEKSNIEIEESTKKSMYSLLTEIFGYISKRRKYQFLFLLILTIASSIAEVVSLGAVVPFIGILTQPETVFNEPRLSGFISWLGINSPAELVLPLTIIFSIAAIVAAILRLILLWISILLSNATGADLAVDVYRKTLYQPYSVHIARGSSEIISGITLKVTAATSVLTALVTVVTSAFLLCAILGTLVFIHPEIAMLALTSFGFCYFMIAWITRKRLRTNSQEIASKQTLVIQSLQEGLGGIRDVLLDGTQDIFSEGYKSNIQKLLRATGENQYITLAPRFLMESLGMILIAMFALFLRNEVGGIAAALPILGAMALAAQRLLPLLQMLYGNWATVAGSEAALKDVLELLDQQLPRFINQSVSKPLAFKKNISLENASFRYKSNTDFIINNVNLEIIKGSKVGFVGETGVGKSTVLDLVMALLEQTTGSMFVDGKKISDKNRREWQKNIAHVPQNIYLSDATIAENIAFGVPKNEINMELIRKTSRQAQISDFIEASSEGYDSAVGERGVRLSGGQRQRIGIARALYKQVPLLILDEATSALDSATEKKVMYSMENLNQNLTILIIAHRHTTLQNCDVIIELKDGQMLTYRSYKNFMDSND